MIIPIRINRIFTSESDLMQGLMYVKKLNNFNGALFCMPYKKIHKFWMKNTYINIRDAKAFDENMYYVKKTSLYIIEVKSGFIDKKNVSIGDIIKPVFIKSKI
jgi:uncharacterized membrane protein (UPF0127 family)